MPFRKATSRCVWSLPFRTQELEAACLPPPPPPAAACPLSVSQIPMHSLCVVWADAQIYKYCCGIQSLSASSARLGMLSWPDSRVHSPPSWLLASEVIPRGFNGRQLVTTHLDLGNLSVCMLLSWKRESYKHIHNRHPFVGIFHMPFGVLGRGAFGRFPLDSLLFPNNTSMKAG